MSKVKAEELLILLEKAYPEKWPDISLARIVVYRDGSGKILQDVDGTYDKEMFRFSELEALVEHLVGKVKKAS